MAIMRPPLEECERLITPLNEGERRVAEKLSELDDEWTVYVQPRLAQDIPDFVAVHPRHGVCAVEVKHWSTGAYRQADDGTVETNRCGVWRPTTEAPRYQAWRYRTTIYDQFFALPQDGDRPSQAVRAVLILPQWQTRRAEALLERATVTEDELSIRVLGGEALQGAADGIVRRGPVTNPVSIARLHRHLAESDASRELRIPPKLSEGAKNVQSNRGNAQRRRVRGAAGSGKSFGLAARAARLAASRQHVLVLTYNTTLANYLRTLVSARCKEEGANPSLVTCVAFHPFCGRLVDDAAQAGFPTVDPEGVPWYEAMVARAVEACEAGYERRFDAVLVDEGQDFTLEWWNFLRNHVVRAEGEMLLVADPTQDVYGQRAWTDEDHMIGAGFSGKWTELEGSYRMPADLVPLTNRFAEKYLDGERLRAEVPADHASIAGTTVATVRHWELVSRRKDLGAAVGHEVVRLLTTHPDLNPRDLVFLCEHHDDGLAAVPVIEAAGFEVHHIFAAKDTDRSRRKRRFWPDALGVKGCTVKSFKGWEAPALVLGIGTDAGSPREAYVGMTRVKARNDGLPSYLSVVSANFAIAGFQSTFTGWGIPSISMWAPPVAGTRVIADEGRIARATAS
jgi:hypothetical protein